MCARGVQVRVGHGYLLVWRHICEDFPSTMIRFIDQKSCGTAMDVELDVDVETHVRVFPH